MKKLFTYSVAFLITVSMLAQSPQKMSYQCVIRNTGGALVTNQGVGLRISILQGTTSGTVAYSETYSPNPQTNTNGLVTVEIGSGVPVSGSFSDINWASGPYFLKTETDPAGGTNYTIVGTSQLLSVPYAMYAKTAENGSLWSKSDPNIYFNTGRVGVGTSDPATYIHGHGLPIASRGQLSLSSPVGQDIYLSLYEANNFKSYLWYNVAEQDLRLQNVTAGDLNLNPYGGNVGIGTNTPGAMLEVAGQIKISGGTPSLGRVLTSDGTGLAEWKDPATGGIGGSGYANTVPLFTGPATLGNSNINYSSTWGGSYGIGASPDVMQSKFLVQYFSPLGSAPLPYIARFQTRAPTIPAIVTDLAYITGNGDAYFRGQVSIGPNNETVIGSDGNALFSNSLTVGPTGSGIAEFKSFTGILPAPIDYGSYYAYNIDLPGIESWIAAQWVVVSAQVDLGSTGNWFNCGTTHTDHSAVIQIDKLNRKDSSYRVVVMRFN
jgi:hypothetical protein